jgi:hypothetical protein
MSGKGTDKDNNDLEKMADRVIPISICAKCGCRKDEHTTGNGAMLVLNLADNAIGGYYDDERHEFISTPDGI